jgi:molybdopterin-containing oxidoreductase family iron-sulfur binding subunit
MHWLRIDRYYSSESTFEGDNERKENIAGLSDSSTFNEMEKLEIILKFLFNQ